MLHESTRIGIQGTGELDVVSTLSIETNGLALQGVMENGIQKARPSNGLANSTFLGFSFGIVGRGAPAAAPYAEVNVASAAVGGFSTFTMDFPVATGLTIMLGTGYGATALTPTANATTAPTSDTQYQLGADNRTVTVTGANAGRQFFSVYRYAPTVAASRWTYGDYIPGNRASQNFGRIGVIQHGLVFTDQFDTSVNWAAVNDKSAANVLIGDQNGLVSIVGSGGKTGCVINAKVYRAPNADLPFLGLAVGEAVGP